MPKIYYPFITGANNEKLSQLINETNTRINIPPPSVESDEITITGEKEGVENAKNRILQIYEEMVNSRDSYIQLFVRQRIISRGKDLKFYVSIFFLLGKNLSENQRTGSEVATSICYWSQTFNHS